MGNTITYKDAIDYFKTKNYSVIDYSLYTCFIHVKNTKICIYLDHSLLINICMFNGSVLSNIICYLYVNNYNNLKLLHEFYEILVECESLANCNIKYNKLILNNNEFELKKFILSNEFITNLKEFIINKKYNFSHIKSAKY